MLDDRGAHLMENICSVIRYEAHRTLNGTARICLGDILSRQSPFFTIQAQMNKQTNKKHIFMTFRHREKGLDLNKTLFDVYITPSVGEV